MALLLALFVAFGAHLVLGSYVLLRSPRRPVNRAFFAFAMAMSLWSLSACSLNFFIRLDETQYVELWGRLAFVTGSFVPGSFLIFALIFPRPLPGLSTRRNISLIFLASAVFACLSMTNLIQAGITKVGNAYAPINGPALPLLTLYTGLAVLAGLGVLVRKYRAAPAGFERMQLRYTFFGIAVASILSIATSLVLPQVGIRQYLPLGPAHSFINPSLGPASTMVITVLLTYAILRYRLMDIGVVLRSSLIYGIVVVSLAAIALTLQGIFTHFAPDRVFAAGSVTAVGTALALMPLRRRVEVFVDRVFFKGRYSYHQAVADFGETMTSILELYVLQDLIVTKTARMLQVENAVLLMIDDAMQEYRAVIHYPEKEETDAPVVLSMDNPLVQRLHREGALLVREELKRVMPPEEFEPLGRELDRLKAAVVVPFTILRRAIGILVLGEKLSRDIYSEEDINLLTVLGNQAATAIENARLYSQMAMLKNHNENLVESMNSGLIAVDSRMKITTFNRAAESITRINAADIVGQPVHALPEPLARFLTESLVREERYPHRETEIEVEKRKVPVSVSTSLLRDESGNTSGALLLFSDLTELKGLQAAVRSRERLAWLGQFAANVAHEIKNPLVSIRTFAQLLPEKYDDDEFRNGFSALAIEEVNRINSIVEGLLNFARPAPPRFASADLHRIIDETLKLLSNQLPQKRIQLVKDYMPGEAEVHADADQLRQVFLNIFLNAFQAMDSGGVLSVRTELQRLYPLSDGPDEETDSGSIRIEIHDTGPGIREEDLQHVFEPFFSTKTTGSGLGLSISQTIIREHHGSVSLTSQQGKGTTVTIELPIRSPAVVPRGGGG